MTTPDAGLPQSFRQETNRAAVIFVTAVIALFGGLCLFSFISKLSYLGADEWFLGILGGALIVFDVLLWRYLARPGVVLTDSCLITSRLWGVRPIRYADVLGFSAYLERIHPPLINGTRMPSRIVHRLLVKTRASKEILVTLPAFGSNETLIQALEQNSGLTVVRLPDVDKGR